MRKFFVDFYLFIIRIVNYMIRERRPHVQLTFRKDDPGSKAVNVKAEIIFAFASKEEANGMYTYYVPCFDICFSANNRTEGNLLVQDAVSAFIHFWFDNKGMDLFIRQ